MCISCGCKDYNDSHGDERNITVDTLREAASASSLRLTEVLTNLREGAAELGSNPPPEPTVQGGAVKDRLHPD